MKKCYYDMYIFLYSKYISLQGELHQQCCDVLLPKKANISSCQHTLSKMFLYWYFTV